MEGFNGLNPIENDKKKTSEGKELELNGVEEEEAPVNKLNVESTKELSDRRIDLENVSALKEEVVGMEVFPEMEVYRTVAIESLGDIEDLLNNPSEDGFDNELIAYRGIEELEKQLPEGFDLDLSVLKKSLSEKIKEKEGFDIGEMENLDQQLVDKGSDLRKELVFDDMALSEEEKTELSRELEEFKALEEKIKDLQREMIGDAKKFYSGALEKTRKAFLEKGEYLDEKALNSKLLRSLGEKGAFSKAAAMGAATLVLTSCAPRFLAGGLEELDVVDIEDGDIEILDDDANYVLEGDLDGDGNLSDEELEKLNAEKEVMDLRLEKELIAGTLDFDKLTDEEVTSLVLDQVDFFIYHKEISLEDKKKIVSLLERNSVNSGVLLVSIKHIMDAFDGDFVLDTVEKNKSKESFSYLFLEDSEMLDFLSKKEGVDLERLREIVFSMGINLTSFELKDSFRNIHENFADIAEQIALNFIEEIKTEENNPLQAMKIFSYLKDSGSQEGRVVFEEYRKKILEMSPAIVLNNVRDLRYFEKDVAREILQESISNISDEADYRAILFNDNNFGVFDYNADENTKRMFLEQVSKIDPWLIKSIFEEGKDKYDKEVAQEFKDFAIVNSDLLEPILKSASESIDLAKDSEFFPSKKIRPDEFPIDRKTFEAKIMGLNSFARERRRPLDDKNEGIPFGTISIPMKSFNQVFYSDEFQEILERESFEGKMSWMNAISLTQATYREINRREDANLSPDNIKNCAEAIVEQRENVANRELLGPNNYLIVFTGEGFGGEGNDLAKIFVQLGGNPKDILIKSEGRSSWFRENKKRILDEIRNVGKLPGVKEGSKTVTIIGSLHGSEGGGGYILEENDHPYKDFEDASASVISAKEMSRAISDSGVASSLNTLVDSCYAYDTYDNQDAYSEMEGEVEKPLQITAANEGRTSVDSGVGKTKISSFLFKGMLNYLIDKNEGVMDQKDILPLTVGDIYEIESTPLVYSLEDVSIKTGDPEQYTNEGVQEEQKMNPEELKKFREEFDAKPYEEQMQILKENPPKNSMEIGKGLREDYDKRSEYSA